MLIWRQLPLLLAICILAYSPLNFAESQNKMLTRGYEALARGDYAQSLEIFTGLVKQSSPEAHFVSALFYKHGWGR